jgi:hypothetical protein
MPNCQVIRAGQSASPFGSELPHGCVPGKHQLHERPARRRAPPTKSFYYSPGQGRSTRRMQLLHGMRPSAHPCHREEARRSSSGASTRLIPWSARPADPRLLPFKERPLRRSGRPPSDEPPPRDRPIERPTRDRGAGGRGGHDIVEYEASRSWVKAANTQGLEVLLLPVDEVLAEFLDLGLARVRRRGLLTMRRAGLS